MVKEWESEQYWVEQKNQRSEHFYRFDAVYSLIGSYIGKNERVLELGCGVGYFAGRWLAGRCSNFLSIDFSKEAIDVARGNYPSMADKFSVFDMRRLSELDYPYTMVVATEVLEHTDSDVEVLESIRAATPVLFSVPKEEKIKKTPTRYRRSYTYATFEDRYGKVLAIERIFSIGVGLGMRMLKGKMVLDDRHSYVVVGRRR